MNLHIDFSTKASKQLTAAARNRGIDPKTLLEDLVAAYVPTVEAPGDFIPLPPTGRAAARLRARLVAEATDDPEELRKAQEDLDAMKRSLNAERARSGAEPIF